MEIYHAEFQKEKRASLLRNIKGRMKGGHAYEALGNMLQRGRRET